MEQHELIIRYGEARDVDLLAEFNVAMARETEARQLDRPVVMAGVRGLLANPHAGFYVVAETGGIVIGSLMVTYEWSDWRNKCFWWIQSVYIQPSHRRRRVFTRLFQYVRQQAELHEGVCGLRLYVEQGNRVAQATYKSLGMDESHYDMYEVDL
jgi:GNAT superfamily N-acetyltransferase